MVEISQLELEEHINERVNTISNNLANNFAALSSSIGETLTSLKEKLEQIQKIIEEGE